MTLAPEVRAELQVRLRTDTPFWARNCATILTEDKVPVRLVPRPWQARTPETPAHVVPFDEALERQRAAGKPMRAIVLKARKLGFSTWVQAKFMQRVTQLPFQFAAVAAHDRKTAGVLADMADLIYERLPSEEELGLGINIRPDKLGEGKSRGGSGRWMALGDPRRPSERSVYETLTAASGASGRGYTPSMFHGSEVAHYDDPDFLTGALTALPMRPETIAVLETTANGFNHFFDTWDNAVRGAEDPETGIVWEPLFYGWQDNPFNALAFMSDQARDRFERTIGDPDGGGDEEETWLVEQFGVTLEQLNWRRAILNGPECRGKLELFHQEHPATPEQAFIGSGNPVFSQILVGRAIKTAEEAPPSVDGVIRGLAWKERRTRAGAVLVPQKTMWVPGGEITAEDSDRWGMQAMLRVWEHPVNETSQETVPEAERRPDGQYVAFVDIAQGDGTTGEDRDYSVIQVVDHVTRLQVARYRSRVPIHDLPILAYLVGLHYNLAWLAPEVTGLGIGVLDALAKDLRYPRLYRRRRAGDDRRADQREELLGWQTDLRTKPLMEQTMGQALKEGTHGLRDVATARQFTTYVEDDRGRHGAQRGTHDDLVMSYMGAVRIAAELKPRDSSKGRRSVVGHTVDDDVTGY